MAGTINSFPINTKGWPDFALNTTPSDSDLIMTRSGSSTAPMTSEVSRQFHGGIIPWTGSFSFKAGGYTDRNGSLYRAKQDHSNQDPELDVTETYWEPKDGLTPSDRVELKSGRKNFIINGNFDIWQRSTSQTSSAYGSDDRWDNVHIGSTKTHSQQTFTLGQTDVPGNPDYFSRTVVTSVAGAGNFTAKIQKIVRVSQFSGKTITLSFWAKADSNKDICTEYQQVFGSGGSPSASVDTIGSTTHSLTTSWQKFTVTTTIPSVTGKTLGTNGDDRLQLYFWLEAGSDLNSRTNSLGQQSGTFDIAQVQVEEGDFATDFERRTLGEELKLCQYYFRTSYNRGQFPGAIDQTGQHIYVAASTETRQKTVNISSMRGVPAITIYNPLTGNPNEIRNQTLGQNDLSINAARVSNSVSFLVNKPSAHVDGHIYSFHYTADAEI